MNLIKSVKSFFTKEDKPAVVQTDNKSFEGHTQLRAEDFISVEEAQILLESPKIQILKNFESKLKSDPLYHDRYMSDSNYKKLSFEANGVKWNIKRLELLAKGDLTIYATDNETHTKTQEIPYSPENIVLLAKQNPGSTIWSTLIAGSKDTAGCSRGLSVSPHYKKQYIIDGYNKLVDAVNNYTNSFPNNELTLSEYKLLNDKELPNPQKGFIKQ